MVGHWVPSPEDEALGRLLGFGMTTNIIIRIGLTIEARDQLGGQLGAFLEAEAQGTRQHGLGFLGHASMIAGSGREQFPRHRLGNPGARAHSLSWPRRPRQGC